MRLELSQWQQRLGVPMILITHDPEDARILGEHVLYLRDGRIDTVADNQHEVKIG
jgi:molybdate transport system ATP-binding protein